MNSIRVVLDTNVVISAYLNDAGFERYVLDLVLAGKLELVVSKEILEEYEAVLCRPKFGFSRKMVARSLRMLRSKARIVRPRKKLSAARDPDDNRFLECAHAARAHFLVTGNSRHFPKAWRQTLVLTARELVEWIAPDLRR
jgi:putative PIN family toxin of toxin-antitoxin system